MQGITTGIFKSKSFRTYFLILIGALFVFNDIRLMAAAYEQDSPSVFFIVPAYAIAFLSVALLLLNRSVLVRTIAQILLFSSLYTDALYLIISEFPFSYPDAINLFNNPEYAPNALVTFITAFLLAFVAAAVVYAAVYLSLKLVSLSFSPVTVILFIIIQVSLIVYSKDHPGIADFFPAMYRVTGNLLTANNTRPEERWRRRGVSEQPARMKVKHVFVVVDESVTGNALSVNGFPLSTTPYLQANAEKFINFGTASSFTNFSAGSNLSLMCGMQLNELPDKQYTSFYKPGIFQYAKKAGYKTFLLDAQTSGKDLQNYITAGDLSFIDTVFQPGFIYPKVALSSRDSIIADKISQIAKRDQPAFTYVIKAGAHWPYHTNFPEDSLKNLFSASVFNKNKNAAYFKSLFWNVDRFWEKLCKKLQHDSSVLIIYTSDHGEDYATPSFKIKHASIYKTNTVEGLVPLLVFDKANFFPQNFRPAINKYSHQYIFPTLLLAMGYRKNFINAEYGRSLQEPPYSAPRWFQTGDLFGRGKNNRVYVDQNKTP